MLSESDKTIIIANAFSRTQLHQRPVCASALSLRTRFGRVLAARGTGAPGRGPSTACGPVGPRAVTVADLRAARGGIAHLVTPSPALGAIVGVAPLSRAELTTRVWAYIEAHELQDAQDRRQIHADATLKKVLGRDQVSMFEMTKLLNQHVK